MSRRDWWLCTGIDLVIAYLAFHILDVLPDVFSPLRMVLWAGLFWATLCANIKRLHDRNWPGIAALFVYVPAIGTVWMLFELGYLHGTKGHNPYGPDPLSVEGPAETTQPLPKQLAEVQQRLLAAMRQQRHAAVRTHGDVQKAAPATVPVVPAVRQQKPEPRQLPLVQYCYNRPARTVTRG